MIHSGEDAGLMRRFVPSHFDFSILLVLEEAEYMKDVSLKAHYIESHALVIGINDYMHASPLEYAVNDAQEFALRSFQI